MSLDVSVCIVNWNCADHLRGCLRSLLHQEQGARFEVIVADNGSSDGAPEMVAKEFPEVTLIRNAGNSGFAKGNNQCAAVASGRYLFFLNNDTLVAPFTLGRLVEQADARPDVSALGPHLVDGAGKPQCASRSKPTVAALLHRTMLLRWTGLFRSAYRRYRGRRIEHASTHDAEVLMGAALLIRRESFDAVGGWREEYRHGGEDIDLCIRLGQTGRLVHWPEVEVTHFGRVGSRRNVGYAYTNTMIGITRSLRISGCSSWAITLYKMAVTLDVPCDWLRHAWQYLWRRLRGRRARAARSLLGLRGLTHFLRHGLPSFWAA